MMVGVGMGMGGFRLLHLGGETAKLAGSARAPWTAMAPSRQAEIALVFVGSSTCMWSRTNEVRQGVHAAQRSLADVARREGATMRSVGIAVGDRPADGLEFLANVASFDEVAIGGGWSSLGVTRYLVRDFPGPDKTPQLLVLRRVVGEEGWGITRERLLLRLVGAEEIASWTQAGAPITTESAKEGGRE